MALMQRASVDIKCAALGPDVFLPLSRRCSVLQVAVRHVLWDSLHQKAELWWIGCLTTDINPRASQASSRTGSQNKVSGIIHSSSIFW